ncbi:hypothetical protein PpBr36_04172 [Pyricularia pennisetigena]|uniref:hypothetical protein n=1 Tax=Pyricularia pennisetigena TaxID=1578925 RepID=UPI00114DCC9F|nr:hypothetical protein PpBr36_04172 [Pyricularia pennisetigena]TLS26740.1 hypothetical protein PpBr36_04172 [Pyricularia pennisetigena]
MNFTLGPVGVRNFLLLPFNKQALGATRLNIVHVGPSVLLARWLYRPKRAATDVLESVNTEAVRSSGRAFNILYMDQDGNRCTSFTRTAHRYASTDANISKLSNMSTEQIIPLHVHDAMPMYTNMVLTVMLKYDRVLDPGILRDAMTELIDREGWRKLGSRLKRNEKGELVYHVPTTFDQNHPAITFSHVHHDTAIADHPLARHMPSRKPEPHNDQPAVVLDPEHLTPLARRADAPRTKREFITRGLPQLELHVVTFRDGTTVGVSCLHSLLDAMGLGAGGLLGAWSLVLRGRGHEVPPVCGVDRDLLRDLPRLHLGAASPPEYKHARHVMGSWGALTWVLRRGWEVLRHPEEEVRVVRVPGAFVTRLREAVLERLAVATAGADSDDGGGRSSLLDAVAAEAAAAAAAEKSPWVSEGDVLVAWWSRYATLHLADQPDRPVMLTNAYSMRKALAGTLLPPPARPGGDGAPGHVYLGNCVTGLNVHMTVRATAATAATAAAVRRSLVELGTVEQLAAMHALCMPDPRRLWKMRMAGRPDSHMCIFTNWSQAQFYQIDLSPAAVADGQAGQEKEDGQQAPLLPGFVGCWMHSPAWWPLRDQFVIIGKDGQGDYWISGTLRKGLWAKIDEGLRKEEL